MKNYLIILAAIFAIILAAKDFVNVETKEPASTAASSLESQTSDAGEVVVVATPKTLRPNQPALFDLKIDTHSVELSYDLSAISTITLNSGQILTAQSWDGGSGGHHLQGNLLFPNLIGSPKTVTLTLKGIAGQDRIFTWTIK